MAGNISSPAQATSPIKFAKAFMTLNDQAVHFFCLPRTPNAAARSVYLRQELGHIFSILSSCKHYIEKV